MAQIINLGLHTDLAFIIPQTCTGFPDNPIRGCYKVCKKHIQTGRKLRGQMFKGTYYLI